MGLVNLINSETRGPSLKEGECSLETFIGKQEEKKTMQKSRVVDCDHRALIDECRALRHSIDTTRQTFMDERFGDVERALSSDFPECSELPLPILRFFLRTKTEGEIIGNHKRDLEIFVSYLEALEEEESSHDKTPNYSDTFKNLAHRTKRAITKLAGRLSQLPQTESDAPTAAPPTAQRSLTNIVDHEARSLRIQTVFWDYQASCAINVETYGNQHGCLD